ncbi:BatA and WFA domain-containing protein [Candidatus Woesearchaeota archaeon]|nr:BatA and WFA domain-containing protein [Candidatus Woesearchaeota archaeon]
MPFERLMGALAFLSLVPFIILYLRRPKPTEQTIPSLMFFISERGATRFHSFLRHLIRNMLFLLQLAILSLLAFSVMGFFMEVPAEKTGNTVIVLDVSASMQAEKDGITRFEQAVGKAGELLNGRVSIVLASNVPRVVLESSSAEAARKVLRTVEPLDTSSNIGDAILIARDILGGKGEIIVLSDFIATEGIDPIVAKRAVSQDAFVSFFNFGGKAENIGIIGMDVDKSTTRVVVDNFDGRPRDLKIQIVNNGAVQDEAALNLPANSMDEFEFDTLQGQTEVRLIADDDFEADNTAYVSVPANAKIRTLLITNSENTNVEAALSASPNIILDVAKPPVINRFNYDVIVLHKFDPKLMLPGHYKEVERVAKNGTGVIVTAQENLADADIGFLPVKILGIGGVSRNIVNITNYFTDGIDFGVNERFLTAAPKGGTTTVVTADGSPVLALAGTDSGNVVYYGLIDDYSSFKSSTTYPQFWSRLVNFLTNTEDLGNFNFEVGRIDVIPKQTIDTPLGKIKTERLLFDKAGFYTYDKRTVAANMLNVRESSVSSEASVFSEEERKVTVEKSKLKENRSFTALLAAIVAVMVFAELLYIKFRGDL